MEMTRTVHAVCSLDCPDSCGVLVTVDTASGRAVKVQGDPAHPVTRGFLCGKVAKYLDRVYAADRLLYPMRRKAGVAKGPLERGRELEAFERVSWDEALSLIVARLQGIVAEFGGESVLPYSYAGTIAQLGYGSMDRRFFHRLGASQLDRTICAAAGGEALKQVYGVKLGTTPQEFAEAGLVIAWGANIHGNSVHLWPFIEEARRNGGKLVVIDPYKTRTAALADEHLQINPGTDGLLALGLMHVIFREGLEDREYMAACTHGAAELRAHALKPEHRPDRVAEVTGIPAASLEGLAQAYALAGRDGRKPAAIRLNYGIQRCENGGTAARAVAMLPLITGSWKHRGGGLLLSMSGAFPFNGAKLEMPELMRVGSPEKTPRVVNMNQLGAALTELGQGDELSVVSCQWSVLSQAPKSSSRVEDIHELASAGKAKGDDLLAVSDQLLAVSLKRGDLSADSRKQLRADSLERDEAPVKVLFVYNSNPAAVAPNQNAVLRGMRREDLFMVVHDQFLTDTADYADVLLPAPTFLETKDVQGSYGHRFVQINERAIEPRGEVRNNVEVFGELGRRMFPGEAWAEDGVDALIEQALETKSPWMEGITRERLEREGHVKLALEDLPFSDASWFRTASGKGELVPVPEFVANAESRASEDRAYPLEFLPRKADHYMNSTFANHDVHQRMEAATAGVLEMHEEDAAARGVAAGDEVEVFNARGRIALRVKLSGKVGKGVVAARLDWNKLRGDLSGRGASVNALTSERLTDIGGGATFYSTLVEVRKTGMTGEFDGA